MSDIFSISVAFYTPFLKEVWEKKPEIEQAFHMEEPVTLDSGEGTLEHSMHHHHDHIPQPPPRHESYMKHNMIMNNINNNNAQDGSGSENCEHLPVRSLNGPQDHELKLNLNDNNEKYPLLYMHDKDMGIDDSYVVQDEDKSEKNQLLNQGKLFQDPWQFGFARRKPFF